MENYLNTFLEITFMIVVFLLAYIIFIKLVIKILILLDGS